MAGMLVANQENLRGPGASLQKRHLKNCPTSSSKRVPLQPLVNNIPIPQDVCLPPHLDPLLGGFPSNITSFSFCETLTSHSFTALSSPEPMLVSSPMEQQCSHNMEMLENEELTSTYAADIYRHLRQSETLYQPITDYMRKQPDITNPMRVILVDWLVEVCDEFNLLPDTLFMSVSYVDRYLSLISIPRTKLQLVGVTGLYIAAKFEEIYPPEISEFAYITDDTYTKKQIVQMEREMLKVLQYNLIQPSSYTFLMRYLKVSERISINFDQITLLSQYLCELALQDAEPFLKYLPSVIASSALCLSRHSLNETPWPLILQYYSGYCIADLSNCIQDLHRTHSMAPCQQQQAIRVKYSSEKCMHIAIMKPTETLPL